LNKKVNFNVIVLYLTGTSPVTAFIESSTGIREGGRTGLTALTVSAYFLLSFFFTPLLASIPVWAVGPPLVLVGVLMMKSVVEIDWHDMKQAIPAFITLIGMPLTYSIAYGLIGGIGTYIVINLFDWAYGAWIWIKKKKGVGVETNNGTKPGTSDTVANQEKDAALV
jgi:adenine/guanine/hypoxanthine permease